MAAGSANADNLPWPASPGEHHAIKDDYTMENNQKLFNRQPWMPFAFCTVLSAMALVKPLLLRDKSDHLAITGFLIWLPMCFYFVGSVIARLQNDVRDLRRQLADINGKSPH